jgi:hypothetical protein
MKDFFKDLRKVAKDEETKTIISMYVRGFITLADALRMIAEQISGKH